MHESKQKEEMSKAYILAVCAQAGIAFSIDTNDADSTDGWLKKEFVSADGSPYQSDLRAQLKSTSSRSVYNEYDTYISYRLKRKNYDDLIKRSTVPIILAVLIMPDNKDDWTTWTEEELIINCRMYWTKVERKDSVSDDSSSEVWVRLDKSNPVNKDTLTELLRKIAEDEF